jgi:hypothetical protein
MLCNMYEKEKSHRKCSLNYLFLVATQPSVLSRGAGPGHMGGWVTTLAGRPVVHDRGPNIQASAGMRQHHWLKNTQNFEKCNHRGEFRVERLMQVQDEAVERGRCGQPGAVFIGG